MWSKSKPYCKNKIGLIVPSKKALKVMTVVGTRPEVIRLARVLPTLDQYFEHTLVHTGQNYDYELNTIFFDELGLRKPDVVLDVAGKTGAETIGQVIAKTDAVFEQYQPDALLILGDTNSALCAIGAKRRKIPIFHMEAGNRCFDFRVPEEINRRIVDHIADINMPYSTIARDYLIAEGLPADQVIKTGSPMREVLDFYKSQIKSSNILKTLGLTKEQYFVVSPHREENIDSQQNLGDLISLLNHLAQDFQLPIIFSVHPRTLARLEKIGTPLHHLIKIMKPFGFFDYIALQKNARCVLSDSGTITEESSILNFPALNIRQTQERPEGFEEGAVMMVGMNTVRVKQALDILKDQTRQLKMVDDYMIGNVSDKVARIILSYVDFVKQRTWKK
jgi:UDP-N-acetylglucosamine 2-epimerase (non-hydrolysing)